MANKEKKEGFDFNDPNQFMHTFMKNLGPLGDSLKSVAEKAEKMGIHKQYSFKFRGREGHMVIYKPHKTISINITDITDEEVKEILHLLHDKKEENTDNEETK